MGAEQAPSHMPVLAQGVGLDRNVLGQDIWVPKSYLQASGSQPQGLGLSKTDRSSFPALEARAPDQRTTRLM